MDHLPLNGRTTVLVLRAAAINHYSQLESSLSMIFAALLKTDLQTAGIVFYRIVNTKSRNTILDSLLRLKHGDTYAPFWKSVIKLVRQLDTQRNEIIHWHIAVHIPDGLEVIDLSDPSLGEAKLEPPNGWLNSSPSSLDAGDLQEFCAKCKEVTRALNIFHAVVSDLFTHMPREKLESFRRICQQPFPYPLPDSHPLSPNYKAPETPPQP